LLLAESLCCKPFSVFQIEKDWVVKKKVSSSTG